MAPKKRQKLVGRAATPRAVAPRPATTPPPKVAAASPSPSGAEPEPHLAVVKKEPLIFVCLSKAAKLASRSACQDLDADVPAQSPQTTSSPSGNIAEKVKPTNIAEKVKPTQKLFRQDAQFFDSSSSVAETAAASTSMQQAASQRPFEVAMAAAAVVAATTSLAPPTATTDAALPPASSTSLVVDMGPSQETLLEKEKAARRKEANDFNYAKTKFTGDRLRQWNSVKELPQNHPSRREFRAHVLKVCSGEASYNDHYFEKFTKKPRRRRRAGKGS